MAPKQTKFDINRSVQFTLSLDNEKEIEKIREKITLLCLMGFDAIVFSNSFKNSDYLLQILEDAKELNSKLNLGVEKFPYLKIAVGILDPLRPNNFYCMDQISYKDINTNLLISFENSISSLSNKKIEGIRFHPGSLDLELFDLMWQIINDNFDREYLSIHIDRVNQSNAHIVNLLKKAYGDKSSSLIVEVDGASSVGNNSYNDTIQTLATADILIKEFSKKNYKSYKNLQFYFSGEISSKTLPLANLCAVDFNGLSFGSCYNNIFFDKLKFSENLPNLLTDRESVSNSIENYKSILYYK